MFDLFDKVRYHRGSYGDGKDHAIDGAPEVGVVVDVVASLPGHIDGKAQKEHGVEDGGHFYKIQVDGDPGIYEDEGEYNCFLNEAAAAKQLSPMHATVQVE